MTQPNLRSVETSSSDAAKEAREQAEAYDSLFADKELELDDGTKLMIPPHPDMGMLDDEQMAAYEELLFERESYDREPDIFIPEQRLKDENGNETGVVLPAETQPGQLKTPYRRTVDGKTELVKPPWSVRVVRAALGEVDYKRLREGGKSAGDVWRIWGKQGLEVKERQFRGSEDEGSSVGVAAIPEADSE